MIKFIMLATAICLMGVLNAMYLSESINEQVQFENNQAPIDLTSVQVGQIDTEDIDNLVFKRDTQHDDHEHHEEHEHHEHEQRKK